MSKRSPSVLMVTPEAAPFARSGGLGDVAGALPGALQSLGVRTSVIMPFYRSVSESGLNAPLLMDSLPVSHGTGTLEAGLRMFCAENGATFYFLDREDLYDRPNLYGRSGSDYYDNLERFSFLCHGALAASSALGLRPDIIHCHDWQTALVPVLLSGKTLSLQGFKKTRTVFTIHNIGYQGVFPPVRLPATGLPPEEFFHMWGLEYWGKINLMKGGIVYSDAVTTVSPSYALEIQTPEFGMGLEGVLSSRSSSLHGILNGVDYRIWNPAEDPHISANYSAGDTGGKMACKRDLIDRCGLEPSSMDRPVLGMVSRLDRQKGLDLVIETVDSLVGLGTSLVILGTGDKSILDQLEKTASRLPGKVALIAGFDDGMAHRIIAGSDIFLVPSRYEPCGLTQIYALKYGTIPVVRAVGGLEDTILDAGPGGGPGTGFKFKSFEAGAFLGAVKRAIKKFNRPRAWRRIVTASMEADFSWGRSAAKYLALYRSLTG